MKFTQAENFENVADGKYIFQVVGVECGIQSNQGKTNGSPNRDLKLALFDEELHLVGQINRARIILHESIWWKVCTFLISANYLKNGKPLAEGDDIDPNTDLTVEKLMGLRGWCEVKNNPGEKKNAKGETIMFANVDKWLTDRNRFDKVSSPAAQPQTQVNDPWK